MVCTTCGKSLALDGNFCPHCGASLVARCLECGGKNSLGSTVCAECGEPLRSAAGYLDGLQARSLELLELREWDAALAAARQWYRQAVFSIEAERFLDLVEDRIRRGTEPESGDRPEPSRPVGTLPDEDRETAVARFTGRAGEEESEGRWQDAVALYDRALRLAPHDAGLLERREHARGKVRVSLEPIFRRARKAASTGDDRTARKLYEELCTRLPWDMEPLHRWEELQRRRIATQVDRKKRRKRKSRTALAAAAVLVPILVAAVFFTVRFLDRSEGRAAVQESSGSVEMTAAEAEEAGLIVLDPARWSDPGSGGARRVLEIDGRSYAFRWIPSGEAVVGSPGSEPCRDDDEGRWTARFDRGFWLGETEVTVGQFDTVLGTAGDGADRCDRCPVGDASWHDARAFTERLSGRIFGGGFRLPYEAEWEYAARAGGEGPFGAECAGLDDGRCPDTDPACLEAIAWSRLNSGGIEPRPVGLKQANAWGLHDMHGNVSEWCRDWYAAYPEGVRIDYRGPDSGLRRVRRGGGLEDARFLRSANRSAARPAFRPAGDGGFRIVLEIEDPAAPALGIRASRP